MSNDNLLGLDRKSTLAERRNSLQDSRYTYRTISQSLNESIRSVKNFYSCNNKILTENFAGGEFVEEESLTDDGHNKSACTYFNQKGELGFWSTLFTYIKVNIVAGFLFLPSGYKLGGWLFSVLTVLLIGILTTYCSICLSSCTDVARSYSFSKIGEKALGKVGFYVVEIGIAVSQICFPCSYGNLIAQMVSNIFNIWFGTEGNYYVYIGIVLAAIVIPLCLIRNISRLSSLHFIGDLAVLMTILTLIYESISSLNDAPSIKNLPLFNTGWPSLMGMSTTAIEGIGVVLPIKENLKDKKKYNLVIITGTMTISLILMIFPLIMFFAFQNDVSEIVLNNLPLDRLYIQIVIGLLVFSIIIVYPVQLFPAFRIIENLIFPKVENENKTRLRLLGENLMRTIIVIFNIVVGILSINRFDTILSFVGCGIIIPIAFILPSYLHFVLFKNTQSLFRSVCDLGVTILGLIMSLSILIFSLI